MTTKQYLLSNEAEEAFRAICLPQAHASGKETIYVIEGEAEKVGIKVLKVHS